MRDVSAAEIWRGLQEKGVRVRYRAVTAREIAMAEAALGIRFPPSYVELVTGRGAPAIATRVPRVDPNLAENLPYAVLLPSEIVKWTRELRSSLEPDAFEDPSSIDRVRAQLENAVFFQIGSNAGEGFVFLLDTVDTKGEMVVGDYSHDYLEELDWSLDGAVFPSLAASTARVAEGISKHLEHYSFQRPHAPDDPAVGKASAEKAKAARAKPTKAKAARAKPTKAKAASAKPTKAKAAKAKPKPAKAKRAKAKPAKAKTASAKSGPKSAKTRRAKRSPANKKTASSKIGKARSPRSTSTKKRRTR